MGRWSLAVIAVLGSGCVANRARSSGVATASVHAVVTGPVRVCHLFEAPAGSEDMGVIEAHGSFLPIDAIATEFAQRARLQGGNVARIERMKTKYEWVTQTYTYTCGKSTCTGSRQVEVETFSMQGHAFHVPERP
jgi:hypothetical protein